MKKAKKSIFICSMLLLTGAMLSSACSKKEENDPTPETSEGTVSATIEFLDTGEKIQFNGSAKGAHGGGSQDTVVLTFSGKNHPAQMILMLTPVSTGTSRMRENGFTSFGFLHPDTTQSTNYLNAYLLGEDNIDDNEFEADGEASFTISSFSNKHIKGTFELTLIRNTTIKENGEVISGEIKMVKVTNGKFDVRLN